MKLRFGSVCSGIEAASVAWNPLGWEAAWLSEIDPFPCALLEHHYPNVPNLGDMTTLPERILSGEIEAPDILCGGTPCQAFSVAGQRKSLEDERGNLSLVFCEIANAIDTVRTRLGLPPAIIFWENVPGVLNTPDNAFGCFLAGIAQGDAPYQVPKGKWGGAGVVLTGKRKVAWRTLDAQFFGVPQRRRRVYVVASSRKGFDPSKVLFESTLLSRDSQSGEQERKETASASGASPESDSQKYALGGDKCNAVTSKWAKGTAGPSGVNECANMILGTFAEGGFSGFKSTTVAGVLRSRGGATGTGGAETLCLVAPPPHDKVGALTAGMSHQVHMDMAYQNQLLPVVKKDK